MNNQLIRRRGAMAYTSEAPWSLRIWIHANVNDYDVPTEPVVSVRGTIRFSSNFREIFQGSANFFWYGPDNWNNTNEYPNRRNATEDMSGEYYLVVLFTEGGESYRYESQRLVVTVS